jgi:hypothetical protein
LEGVRFRWLKRAVKFFRGDLEVLNEEDQEVAADESEKMDEVDVVVDKRIGCRAM